MWEASHRFEVQVQGIMAVPEVQTVMGAEGRCSSGMGDRLSAVFPCPFLSPQPHLTGWALRAGAAKEAGGLLTL